MKKITKIEDFQEVISRVDYSEIRAEDMIKIILDNAPYKDYAPANIEVFKEFIRRGNNLRYPALKKLKLSDFE